MPIELPFWLLTPFSGAEPPPEGEEENDEEEGDEEESEEDESEKDPEKLKASLLRERQERKRLAKETKELRRSEARRKQAEIDAETAKKGDLEAAQAKLTRAEQQTAKLREGFVRLTVDSAIRRVAEEAGFVDVDDVLTTLDRSKISVDQDEDDPATVDVDEDDVKQAVADLAKRKSHWLKSDDDGEEEREARPRKTGGRYGRGKGGTKGTEAAKDSALKNRFNIV